MNAAKLSSVSLLPATHTATLMPLTYRSQPASMSRALTALGTLDEEENAVKKLWDVQEGAFGPSTSDIVPTQIAKLTTLFGSPSCGLSTMPRATTVAWGCDGERDGSGERSRCGRD
ncbi:hypothetical protein BJV77DRAFT_984685, partial [Russula vinacea]